MISDDIVSLMNESDTENTNIQKQQEENTSLKEKYNKLLETNGNLMQKIVMGQEEKKEEIDKKKEKEEFSMRSCFDEKGNFIIK